MLIVLLTFLCRYWSLRQRNLGPGRLVFNRLFLLHWRTWEGVRRTRTVSILFTLIFIFSFLLNSFNILLFCFIWLFSPLFQFWFWLLRWAVLSSTKERFWANFFIYRNSQYIVYIDFYFLFSVEVFLLFLFCSIWLFSPLFLFFFWLRRWAVLSTRKEKTLR